MTSRARKAATAVGVAAAITLGGTKTRPPAPGRAEPVQPPLNTEEREVVKTLSLARRQRRLQELADALGPQAPNRAARRAQDNRARAHAKHQATKRVRP